MVLRAGWPPSGANIMLNGFGDPNEIEAIREDIANGHNIKVLYSNANMADGNDIGGMMALAEEEFGGVDILVNNAGIQYVAPIEDFPVEKWDAILAINLSSAFHASRLAIPGMKKRSWGRIVNIASAHALVASPFKSAYVAAKHGIAGFTKTAALEVAEHGITVNAVCPGYVMTPLVEKQNSRAGQGTRHHRTAGDFGRAARRAADQALRDGRGTRGAGEFSLH